MVGTVDPAHEIPVPDHIRLYERRMSDVGNVGTALAMTMFVLIFAMRDPKLLSILFLGGILAIVGVVYRPIVGMAYDHVRFLRVRIARLCWWGAIAWPLNMAVGEFAANQIGRYGRLGPVVLLVPAISLILIVAAVAVDPRLKSAADRFARMIFGVMLVVAWIFAGIAVL